jgi:hypothetical protein
MPIEHLVQKSPKFASFQVPPKAFIPVCIDPAPQQRNLLYSRRSPLMTQVATSKISPFAFLVRRMIQMSFKMSLGFDHWRRCPSLCSHVRREHAEPAPQAIIVHRGHAELAGYPQRSRNLLTTCRLGGEILAHLNFGVLKCDRGHERFDQESEEAHRENQHTLREQLAD